VLLMTGPVSSGKTALLEDMVQRLGKGNVVYINGRRSGHTPAGTSMCLPHLQTRNIDGSTADYRAVAAM
jgi:molybdopterin-guanine dinucleotide biosynthesis protein